MQLGYYQKESIKKNIQKEKKQIDIFYSNLIGKSSTILLLNNTKIKGEIESIETNGSISIVQLDEIKNYLLKDIISINIADFMIQESLNEKKSNFIDENIAKKPTEPTERELQQWLPDNNDEIELITLQDNRSTKPWDQFAVNEEKFGVSTDFNENNYTTVLDKSGADFKHKELKAAKLAKEIEKSTTKNSHIAEERGHKISNSKEEDVYSAVIRDKGPMKLFSAATKAIQERNDKHEGKSDHAKNETSKPEKHETTKNENPKLELPKNESTSIKHGNVQAYAKHEHSKAAPVKNEDLFKKKFVKPINSVDAQVIRKTSISQLSHNPNAVVSSDAKEATNNHTVEVKEAFKPFAKAILTHLTDRKNSLSSEGRKSVIADFKAFSKEFQVPPAGVFKNFEPLSLVKEDEKVEAKPPVKENITDTKQEIKTERATAKREDTKPEVKPDLKSDSKPDSKGHEFKKPVLRKPSPEQKEKSIPKQSKPELIPSIKAVKNDSDVLSKSVPVSSTPFDNVSVVSETESHATNTTNATTASAKPFKLSATAAEFTPTFIKKKQKQYNNKPAHQCINFNNFRWWLPTLSRLLPSLRGSTPTRILSTASWLFPTSAPNGYAKRCPYPTLSSNANPARRSVLPTTARHVSGTNARYEWQATVSYSCRLPNDALVFQHASCKSPSTRTGRLRKS